MNIVSTVITPICFLLSLTQFANGALPDLMVSSKDNYWKTGTFSTVTSGTPNVTVDETDKKQAWEGFGGTFNEMGWDALSVVSSQIPTVMKLLFDANDGANFVYGRLPIGASDYATSWYTLAETAGDDTLANFSITRDKSKLIPFVQAALQAKPKLHLWASPWNVPSWMMDGSSNMKSDAKTQNAHALYLAKFVEEYAKLGLTIEGVHVQNEPGYARVHWAQSLLINYFKTYLGPTFTSRHLTAEMWCGTMSAPADSAIAIAVARDTASMKYVTGFGLQWNHTATTATLAPKGRVWQTEHRCGNYNFEAPYWDKSRYSTSKPQNDYLYAEESWQHIRDWVAGGVNAYCAWNMVLDTYGKSLDNWPQNALIVVDRTAKQVIITPAYYVFRHFSQYIDSGATRLGTTGSPEALAFKNPDGNIITQVYNKSDTAQKMTVSVRAALYQFDLPAHSWATLVTKSASSAKADITGELRNSDQNRIRISGNSRGYEIALPQSRAGRIELLTLSGRILESKPIPAGSRKIQLTGQASRSGLFFVRVAYNGGATETIRLVNAR